MKKMILVILTAMVLVILFIAIDSNGDPYYPPHVHTEKYIRDSICIPVDSLWRLNDWLMLEKNTTKMYGEMTRRLLFENDSLRMEIKKRDGKR